MKKEIYCKCGKLAKYTLVADVMYIARDLEAQRQYGITKFEPSQAVAEALAKEAQDSYFCLDCAPSLDVGEYL